MKQIDTIRAVLESAKTVAQEFGDFRFEREADEALAALAELEKAAAEPVACMDARAFKLLRSRESPWSYEVKTPGNFRDDDVKLYAAPPAPVAEIREVVVDDAMARRISEKYHGIQFEADFSVELGRDMIAAVRAELGPTLGLVELKEPTPEECERIITAWWTFRGDKSFDGRAMFDACRAVMWPKEGL